MPQIAPPASPPMTCLLNHMSWSACLHTHSYLHLEPHCLHMLTRIVPLHAPHRIHTDLRFELLSSCRPRSDILNRRHIQRAIKPTPNILPLIHIGAFVQAPEMLPKGARLYTYNYNDRHFRVAAIPQLQIQLSLSLRQLQHRSTNWCGPKQHVRAKNSMCARSDSR